MLNFRPVPNFFLENGCPSLYRSGDILSYDEQAIGQLLQDFHINYFIDLRSESEVRHRGLPARAIKKGLDYISFPLESDNQYFRSKKYPTATDYYDYYVSLLVSNKVAFREIFSLIESRQGQIGLFACYAGKDRTGVLAALLLLAEQVSADDIIADYLATGPSLSSNITYFEANWRKKNLSQAEYKQRMQPKRQTMVMLIDYINRTYGGVQRYLCDSERVNYKELL